MLSKLKHDAAQPQVQVQPPRKRQKIAANEPSSSTSQQDKQDGKLHNYPFPKQKVSTIYLACPPNVQTGGPEAMHQLCHKINSLSERDGDNAVTAYMLYIKDQCNEKYCVQHIASAKTVRAYDMSYSNLKVANFFPMDDEISGNNEQLTEEQCSKNYDKDQIYNSSLIIWPECWTHLIDSLQPNADDTTGRKRFQTAIWWLSVDNNNSKFKDWWRKDIIHLHQSQYAKCYVSDNIQNQKKMNISVTTTTTTTTTTNDIQAKPATEQSSTKETVDDMKSKNDDIKSIIPLTEFIPYDRYCDISPSGKRTLQVVYNPFKGVHYTDAIIKRSSTKFTFTPIGSIEKRISPADVTNMLNAAKVYIDFGPHPGMDRLPREAALCGCIVITNMQGAACYEQDVPIPDEYKVKDFNVDSVHRLLTSCIDDFDERGKDFDSYRSWIHSQESKMDECVKVFLSKVNNER